MLSKVEKATKRRTGEPINQESCEYLTLLFSAGGALFLCLLYKPFVMSWPQLISENLAKPWRQQPASSDGAAPGLALGLSIILGLRSPPFVGRRFFEQSRIILLLFPAFLLSLWIFFEVYILTNELQIDLHFHWTAKSCSLYVVMRQVWKLLSELKSAAFNVFEVWVFSRLILFVW